jgi:hypothetical protein
MILNFATQRGGAGGGDCEILGDISSEVQSSG